VALLEQEAPVHQFSLFPTLPACGRPIRQASHPLDQDPSPADLSRYDVIIVAFSGGKDSIACVLRLLELGVPPEHIELWHHDIDGREGSRLMDWPCTRAYCRAFADALGLRILFSWKVGGFEREMLRADAPTAPTAFELPDGAVAYAGGTSGRPGTRRRFPQVSADLSVRWCSAYLKIDVAACAIRNQERFHGRRTLVVSGERAAESPCRARYPRFEPHRTDRREGASRRYLDHWRPVHQWSDAEVWDILRRWRINPHPAYRLGWGRVSCAACIFGSPDQWASLKAVNPAQFACVAEYEAAFGVTIRRDGTVVHAAERGTPYEAITPRDVAAALSETWDEPILLPEGAWQFPAGAFGDTSGPI
jgi:3'-phosphoadenosine 5'-phosphosulfate sulfotransferase (PAPS reductase)/FAD synthetase